MPETQRDSLERIADVRRRILEQKFKWGGASYFSREHKGDREWDQLGAMTAILGKEGRVPLPVFAHRREHPDFTLYDSTKIKIAGCEVTEVIRPGYRREKFHKEDAEKPPFTLYSVPPPMKNQWVSLTDVLRKKLLRTYTADSWLLVYYDIGMLDTNDWDTPFPERLLAEYHRSRFDISDDELTRFARILILGPDMRSLCEIVPEAHFIGSLPEEENAL